MVNKKSVNLPLRKYFPLNKIERELGVLCDIEDLIHYAAIGELEICVKVNWQAGFDMDSVEADGLRVFSNYDYQKAINALSETDYNGFLNSSYLEVAYETDVTVIEEEIRLGYGRNDLVHKAIEVRGLFSLSRDLFKFSEQALVMGGVFNETILNIPGAACYSIYDLTERDGSEGIHYIPKAISGVKYPVSINNMYVTAFELERFIGRERFVTNNSSQVNVPHGNSERFAIRRESVLMAALYIQKKYPERCGSYSEWARQIDIAAPELWPETGKPPLEIDGVERLLSKTFDPSKWKGN